MDKIKTPATRITDAELNELLREVVKDEILKDARPTLESLKALHADRPLLVLALSQAIMALNTAADQSRVIEVMTERIAEAEKVIDAIYDKSSAVYLDEDGVDRTRGNKLALVYRLARNYKAYLADINPNGDEKSLDDQIASGTKSWDSVDTDKFIDTLRGR